MMALDFAPAMVSITTSWVLLFPGTLDIFSRTHVKYASTNGLTPSWRRTLLSSADDCFFFHTRKLFLRISKFHGSALPCLTVPLYQIFTVMANPVCHRSPVEMGHLLCGLSRQDCKTPRSAQSHPMYSGGFTVLTEFLGVTVSLSISQRHCCAVRLVCETIDKNLIIAV